MTAAWLSLREIIDSAFGHRHRLARHDPPGDFAEKLNELKQRKLTADVFKHHDPSNGSSLLHALVEAILGSSCAAETAARDAAKAFVFQLLKSDKSAGKTPQRLWAALAERSKQVAHC